MQNLHTNNHSNNTNNNKNNTTNTNNNKPFPNTTPFGINDILGKSGNNNNNTEQQLPTYKCSKTDFKKFENATIKEEVMPSQKDFFGNLLPNKNNTTTTTTPTTLHQHQLLLQQQQQHSFNPLLSFNPFIHSISPSTKLFYPPQNHPNSPTPNASSSLVRPHQVASSEVMPYWVATAAALWKNQGFCFSHLKNTIF